MRSYSYLQSRSKEKHRTLFSQSGVEVITRRWGIQYYDILNCFFYLELKKMCVCLSIPANLNSLPQVSTFKLRKKPQGIRRTLKTERQRHTRKTLVHIYCIYISIQKHHKTPSKSSIITNGLNKCLCCVCIYLCCLPTCRPLGQTLPCWWCHQYSGNGGYLQVLSAW